MRKTIIIPGYLHSPPVEVAIVYENKGLALTRRMIGKSPWFEVVHMNTALPIAIKGAHNRTCAYKKKGTMKSFLDYLAQAFDWNTWTKEGNPVWANDAFKHLCAYEGKDAKL